jgi:hypothetical protein
MVDDVETGKQIGDAGVTCQPMLVEIAGEQHVLFAGTADFTEQKFTAVNGDRYPVFMNGDQYRVREGGWMSFPEPFRPGMVVIITGLDGDGGELFRLVSPPLDFDRLPGMFGPGWTTYAPDE